MRFFRAKLNLKIMGSHAILVLAVLLPLSVLAQETREISPYIDIVFCPAKSQPWSCARQQSGRILNLWSDQLDSEWQKLKVEADQQFNATLERRGYSQSENLTKEKPSTLLKRIELGTNYMKDYLAYTFDGFLGRQYYSDVDRDEDVELSDEFVDVEVTRGKKKKKRKALMKLALLGGFLKAKIELLLKILGTHLQIKFLAIAAVGLLINIARFWIDLKRGGGAPQKHHYEDHGDDWGEQGNGGSYWKRSIQTDPAPIPEQTSDNIGYYHPYQSSNDPSYMAYHSQLPSYS
ncbi:uncharacterized protein LOC129945910 isoform X2 [Eupeodes corollae]|uniref:uncharacterized protein LOC129945910 isoform X2 n=1 Tax=Eupeodes corollae TaxID=290404 RepID=UPI002491EC01|nr:uncharacterized protein LOC129945910 isoform X2 [Eupeodes corollae]